MLSSGLDRRERGLASSGRPYRTIAYEGFEIRVGRGDAENDTLTFRHAAPQDFWMHVAGVPGSHVVVVNPDDLADLPRPVLQRAAALAAWHSKARGSRGKVAVHVCRVGDVSKARGQPAGEVMLRRYDTVKVYASLDGDAAED